MRFFSAILLCSVPMILPALSQINVKQVVQQTMSILCPQLTAIKLDSKTWIDVNKVANNLDFDDSEVTQAFKKMWDKIRDGSMTEAEKKCNKLTNILQQKDDQVNQVFLTKFKKFGQESDEKMKNNAKTLLNGLSSKQSNEICSHLPTMVDDLSDTHKTVLNQAISSLQSQQSAHTVKGKLIALIVKNHQAFMNGDSAAIISGCEDLMNMLISLDIDNEMDNIWSVIGVFYGHFADIADPPGKKGRSIFKNDNSAHLPAAPTLTILLSMVASIATVLFF